LLAVFSIFVLLLLWAPLIRIFLKGLNPDDYAALMADGELLKAFSQSLLLGLSSALVAALIGLGIAFLLPRVRSVEKWLLQSGVFMPMILPELILGISLMLWFIKLGLGFGWTTLFIGHLALGIPYAILFFKAHVEVMDWKLVEACQDLGAKGFTVFRHAVWSQLSLPFFSCFLMCFSLSMDDFLISYFVKGTDQVTLPLYLFSMMRLRIHPKIYALSNILFCVSLAFVLVNQLWLGRKLKNRSPLSSH
jgi:spermidine/putrescine transport system permease protein